MPIIKPRHKKRSAQSAMEYLMTYGWAILIIAVVLAALFELGVFNGSNLGPQACIAQAGFVCENPIYTTQGIGFTLGQTKGSTYYGNWVFVTAQGEPLNQQGIPQNFTVANAVPLGTTQNGHALQSGQTMFVVFPNIHFQQGQIPYNAPVGTQFAGYVWLGYCNTQPCTAPVAYAKVATLIVKETGTQSLLGSAPTATGVSCTPSSFAISSSSSCTASVTGLSPTGTVSWTQSGSGSVSFSASQCTLSSSSCSVTVTGSSAGSVTITASYGGDASNGASSGTASVSVTVPTVYNPPNYDGTANVEYNSPVTLNGNVRTTGTITIESGVTLTSDGHIFVAGGTFDNLGTLNTGFLNSSFIPVAQRGNYAFPNSFGGSGGGGGSGCSSSPFSGQNTQASGGSAGNPAGSAGYTPGAPAMSNSNIQTWYADGFSNYLSGAAGGGASNTNYVAGGGAGTYIQANTLIAGTINAMGGDSQACPVSGGNTNDPMGAGGGGGTIMLAYGPGGYTQGTYNVNGGYGGDWGGGGGNGRVATYQWSTAPIPP